MGAGVGVGTLLSSQIPQTPSNTNPNEINIQDSSTDGSGSLFCWFLADSFASVCLARGACDPLIEKVLAVFSGTSVGEVNRTLIASIKQYKYKYKYKYKYRSTEPRSPPSIAGCLLLVGELEVPPWSGNLSQRYAPSYRVIFSPPLMS